MSQEIQAPSWSQQLASLRELSKSGIVTLVLISVFAGYLIGSPLERAFDWKGLAITFFGVLFLSSASAALNQVQELKQDSQMQRTKNRPVLTGRISVPLALGFVGFGLITGGTLLWWVDPAAFILGVLAVFSYNVLYTLWWKRKLAFAAVPGAIPGALPILIGSVGANEDWSAPTGWYLFFILFFWQMPHFWALALKYREDYAQGGFPTLPVVYGEHLTRTHIAIWCLGYVALLFAAPLFVGSGNLYLILCGGTSLKLIYELWVYFKRNDPKAWLRFFLWINFSLILYLFAIALDRWAVYLVPLSR